MEDEVGYWRSQYELTAEALYDARQTLQACIEALQFIATRHGGSFGSMAECQDRVKKALAEVKTYQKLYKY